MATAEAYIAVLESWLAQGIHEDPPRSNRTPIGAEFGWNGVAWCAEGCSVAQERVGLHCFHTASVDEAKHEAQQGQRGMQWLAKDAHIVRADLSVFDFGGRGNPQDFHISSVVDPGTQAKFQTIGCNESDAVRKQWRDRTYIQGFIRLPFDQEDTLPVTDQMWAALVAKVDNLTGAVSDVQSRQANIEVAIETNIQAIAGRIEETVNKLAAGGGQVDVDKLTTALLNAAAARLSAK